jgi:hypothetical protein
LIDNGKRLIAWLQPVALTKIMCGLVLGVVALAGTPDIRATRLPLLLAHVIVFGAVGVFLTSLGRGDPRALALGTLFTLVASLFADPVVVPRLTGESIWDQLLRGLFAFQVDAFIPLFLWLFVIHFPNSAHQKLSSRHLRVLTLVSYSLGLLLLAANLLPLWTADPHALNYTAQQLSRRSPTSWYWPSQYLLCLGAIGYLVSKRNQGLPEDRRRTALLLWVLVAGATPMILWSLLTSVSPAADRKLPLSVAGWIIYPSLLAVPLGVSYAVVAKQALEIRWIVRQVVQYALARYTAIGLACAPLFAVMILTYQRRNEAISTALFTPGVLLLSVCGLTGMFLLQSREGLLERIDRRFFREMYDARRTLSLLIDQCRWVSDRVELASAVRSEVTKALHPQAAWLLLYQETAASYVSPLPGMGPLPADSPLMSALHRCEEYLDCNLEGPSSLPPLPLPERHWLVDTRVRYLLPLRDGRQTLIGAIALGEKQNGLAYVREDWALLTDVASAVEMSIAYHDIRSRRLERTALEVRAVEQPARECDECGRIHDEDAVSCPACGGRLVEAPLPRAIGDRYLLEERLGRGGMGVVYRAVYMELDRIVALKTLPYVSPEESLRLRREARLMALVSHPNLAQIYGVETWQGHPFLVVEYLGGGTLRSRLAAGSLSLPEMVELGRALGAALEAVHGAGILHRDIKPSNIGYSSAGVPKLLDFGLARLAQAPPTLDAHQGPGIRGIERQKADAQFAGSSILGHGTPVYMSPEALRFSTPDAGFDVWSLTVVLYEAFTGVNPFVDADSIRARDRVLRGDVPDVRKFAPLASAQVAAFFRRGLSSNPLERPRTAKALVSQLSALPTFEPSTIAESVAHSA